MLSLRTRWSRLTFKQQAAAITGFIALGATMTGVTVSTTMPAFWQGYITGIWLSATVGSMVWLVRIYLHYRRTHSPR